MCVCYDASISIDVLMLPAIRVLVTSRLVSVYVERYTLAYFYNDSSDW